MQAQKTGFALPPVAGERADMEMQTGPRGGRGRFEALLPLALAALVYLASAGNRAVIDYDEAHYAQVALRMLEGGDWVTPYNNGVRFLEKPPLLYWLTAASLRAFGVNEFALRLPTALGVMALVWVVTRMARRACGARAGAIAGLCAATSAGTYLFTRETLHDIWLVLFVTLAFHAFLEWHLDPRRPLRPALAFYAALAGAVMTKSLVGVAFPAGAAAVFFLLARERPAWRTLHMLPGLALFLVLAAPWHILAALRNPGFLWSFFVNEQFLRFLGRNDPPVLWSVPLPAFWALLPVWFFPWSAFLPAAIAGSRKTTDGGRRAMLLLSFAWIIVILGFYTVAARLEHYAFPVLPALSLLVGAALDGSGESPAVRWAFRGLAVFAVAVLAAAAGAGFWFLAAGHSLGNAEAARWDTVSQTDFSILAEMPASVRRGLLKPAAWTIAALAAGSLAALWFERRRRRMGAVLSLAAAMTVTCGMIHWSLLVCEEMISSKTFALAVAREARPGDRLVVAGNLESANSLGFYQPLRVEVVDGVAYSLIPGTRFPDAPRIVLTPGEFEALWRSDRRVYALVPVNRLAPMRLGGTEISRVLDRALVRNR